jgi:hypothetical protein
MSYSSTRVFYAHLTNHFINFINNFFTCISDSDIFNAPYDTNDTPIELKQEINQSINILDESKDEPQENNTLEQPTDNLDKPVEKILIKQLDNSLESLQELSNESGDESTDENIRIAQINTNINKNINNIPIKSVRNQVRSIEKALIVSKETNYDHNKIEKINKNYDDDVSDNIYDDYSEDDQIVNNFKMLKYNPTNYDSDITCSESEFNNVPNKYVKKINSSHKFDKRVENSYTIKHRKLLQGYINKLDN